MSYIRERNILSQATAEKVAIRLAFIDYCRAKGYEVIKGSTNVTKQGVRAKVLGVNASIKDFTDIKRDKQWPTGCIVRLAAEDFENNEITNNLFQLN